MHAVISYYKIGGIWYLDLPEYLEKQGSHEEDLEGIGSFHDFLELAADGKSHIRFEITAQSSTDTDLLQLTGSSGSNSGAYYSLHKYRGQTVDLELWFNKVIYYFVQSPPEKLYIRELY
jgi:hypothetical protein